MIVALGGFLRFFRLNDMSLWLNEGFTVRFSRLPWAHVTGLHGEYDPHPPLYYTIIKATAVIVPDLYAARVVSAIAGTATLVVLYLIVSRLLNPIAGLLSATALAVSPVHIWYSQEARQYALMTLAVSLSYLALVLFHDRARWRYAALYGASILAAMYIEYSVFFALVPQLLVLALILRKWRSEAMPVIIASGCALFGYLPWIPQFIDSTQRQSDDRDWYLGVSIDRVLGSIWSIAGFHGEGLYFWGGATPWDRWPQLHWLFALLVIGVGVVGSLALVRRGWLASTVGAGVLVGTVALAATLSLISPAYTERTILPAVLGWCVLLGAVPFATRERMTRLPLVGAVGVVVLLSLVSVRAVQNGDKEHWRELTAATEDATSDGDALVTAPSITEFLIGLYEPEALDGPHASEGGTNPLNDETLQILESTDHFWYAYVESRESVHIREQIVAAGFEQRSHQQFKKRLYLDLFVRPRSLREKRSDAGNHILQRPNRPRDILIDVKAVVSIGNGEHRAGVPLSKLIEKRGIEVRIGRANDDERPGARPENLSPKVGILEQWR